MCNNNQRLFCVEIKQMKKPKLKIFKDIKIKVRKYKRERKNEEQVSNKKIRWKYVIRKHYTIYKATGLN